MEYRVMLQRENGMYSAIVPAIPGLKRTGRTKESVVSAVQSALDEIYLSAEWVTLTVPRPTGKQEPSELDTELLAIVESIQSHPMPPQYIKQPAEPITRAFVDQFLAQDNDPDFDAEAWNKMWNAHETEMKEVTRRKEQEFLKDMASLFE